MLAIKLVQTIERKNESETSSNDFKENSIFFEHFESLQSMREKRLEPFEAKAVI